MLTMDTSEPIVFKVFYEDETPDVSIENALAKEPKSKEVRKIVFDNAPDFKQLHDRLLKIESEKLCNTENENTPFLPKYVRIKYIDEDGDRISIACDDDLHNVIEEKKPHVRIHVNLLQQMGKEYNPIAPEISGTSSVVSSTVCSTPTEENNGMICVSCHGPIHGFRYKCVTCAKYDLCSSCEHKGLHPAHDMIRISSPNRSYPPHFFTRLTRLFERLNQQQHKLSSGKRSNGIPPPPGVIEPMAKDLVDEETDYASDYDMESSLHSSTSTSSTNSLPYMNDIASERNVNKVENKTEILPSIEELTKSMRDLTEKDLIGSSDIENSNSKTACNNKDVDEWNNEPKHNASKELLSAASGLNLDNFNDSSNFSNAKCATSNENHLLKMGNTNDLETPNNELRIAENALQNIYQTKLLQNEIENFLAPLSMDVSVDKGELQEDNGTKEDLVEEENQVAKSFETEDCIQNNARKKHFVTTSNTEVNVSQLVVNVDDNIPPRDCYIQSEKRARMASLSNSSSSCSSSPFELCEPDAGAVIVEHAVIETSTSVSETGSMDNEDKDFPLRKELDIFTVAEKNTNQENTPEKIAIEKEHSSRGNIHTENYQVDFDEIETIESTEFVESCEKDCEDINNGNLEQEAECSDKCNEVSQPMSMEEQRELLRVVENHDRIERARAFNKVLPKDSPRAELDDYWLASSRLMLRNRPSTKDNTKSNLYDPYNVSTTSNRVFNNYVPSMYNSDHISSLEDDIPSSKSLEERVSSELTKHDISNPDSSEKNPSSSYGASTYSSRYGTSPATTSKGSFDTSSPLQLTQSNSSWRSRIYGTDAAQENVTTTPLSTRDQNIKDARDQMLSMGFSDDDGWLTQLLEIKNGNIEQVIDQLTDVKNKNRI